MDGVACWHSIHIASHVHLGMLLSLVSGALDRLEVELQDVRSLWMRREAEMTELCDRKQRDVHHDA